MEHQISDDYEEWGVILQNGVDLRMPVSEQDLTKYPYNCIGALIFKD